MGTKQELEENYRRFYSDLSAVHIYPVEFVVRSFLGNYPNLKNRGVSYSGLSALDLGFGDGRNMPLLRNLGFEVFGVEISDEICESVQSRLAALGVDIVARTGRNSSIPFEACRFDCVLACHSCYYIDEGESFEDNLREIVRVLKPGGRFTFSVPTASSYLLVGAKDEGEGHMRVANDPYGLRNGFLVKSFSTESEIRQALGSWFQNIRIGGCQNNFWGIEEHVWTVVCEKKSD